MTIEAAITSFLSLITALLVLLINGMRLRLKDLQEKTVSTKECKLRTSSLERLMSLDGARLDRVESKLEELLQSTARIEQVLRNSGGNLPP